MDSNICSEVLDSMRPWSHQTEKQVGDGKGIRSGPRRLPFITWKHLVGSITWSASLMARVGKAEYVTTVSGNVPRL